MEGAKSNSSLMMELISGLLKNGKAGIMDENILQTQKALEADPWSWTLNDYAIFGLYGKPVAGQSLEELRSLLLSQLDQLKNGEFEDWLIQAVVKNKKLNQLKGLESNRNRANLLVSSFVHDIPWEDYVSWYDRMGAISKDEVVAFANENFKDNYVVINKLIGQDSAVMKVDKPVITPIPLNRENESAFFNDFQQKPSSSAIACRQCRKR